MATSTRTRRAVVHTHPHIIETLASHAQAAGSIAPGFTPAPWLDMTFQGGRTIQKLAYKSFYLGGASYPAADIALIDDALSGAMTDPALNNVIAQYYSGTKPTTQFLGSSVEPGPAKATFTRDDVSPTLQALLDGGQLKGMDFDNTVVCLFLPPGIVLNDTTKAGVGQDRGDRKRKAALLGDDDDRLSSRKGLGGYHGSAHLGGQRVYFAVGVYSDMEKKKANGIPFWPDPWKNVCATMYHELNEARTNPVVEEYNRHPGPNIIAWYANTQDGGEIGDIPMNEAGPRLGLLMVEVKLGSGKSAPVQLMWSNAVHGPQGPFKS